MAIKDTIGAVVAVAVQEIEETMASEPDFISMKELSNKLGISRRSLDRMRIDGRIPARLFPKLGDRCLVDYVKFLEWIRSLNSGVVANIPAPRQSPRPEDPQPEPVTGPNVRVLDTQQE